MSNIRKINAQLSKTLSKLHYSIVEYIEKQQKENGYINTQNGEDNAMYFYTYDDIEGNMLYEGRICAIRVKGGNIQILGTVCDSIHFTNDDIDEATRLTDNIDNTNGEDNPYLTINGECETYWQDIYGNDTIIYTQTLLSIAMSIEQY